MKTRDSVTCPECGASIDIDEVFYKKIESEHKQELLKQKRILEAEVEKKRQEYKAHLDSLKQKEQLLQTQQAEFEKKVVEATNSRLLTEKEKLYHDIKKQIEAEKESSIKLLQEELESKTKQVQELNNAKVEIEKLKRENEQVALKVKLEAENELNKKLNEEKVKIQNILEESNQQKLKTIKEEQELVLKQKEEQLEQLKRSLEDAKKKAEQGSMQTQGEALELTIESYLKSKFIYDEIEEIKKGAFGADCIQTVNTKEGLKCGVICYESKNTKNWSSEWIPKLKQDMLKASADIGVLVTSVYPKEMSQMGFIDGIWVCSLTEFKAVVPLLRDSLINIYKVVQKEENKTDKMSLLYNYLTGNEFSMQLKSIVDGFVKLQEELDKEKRSLQATWKRRQKLIDTVLENTTAMYGSLQGIAGSEAITHIKALELDVEDEE